MKTTNGTTRIMAYTQYRGGGCESDEMAYKKLVYVLYIVHIYVASPLA